MRGKLPASQRWGIFSDRNSAQELRWSTAGHLFQRPPDCYSSRRQARSTKGDLRVQVFVQGSQIVDLSTSRGLSGSQERSRWTERWSGITNNQKEPKDEENCAWSGSVNVALGEPCLGPTRGIRSGTVGAVNPCGPEPGVL